MTTIGHFGVIDDQTIRIGKDFLKKNIAVEAVEASKVAEATEVNEAAEIFKA